MVSMWPSVKMLADKNFACFHSNVENSVSQKQIILDLPNLITLVPSHHPLNITEQVLGPTSFRLSWSPPPVEHHNGVIRGYNVNVTEIETGRKLRYSTQSTAIVIRALHPFYLYNCTMTAFTVGEGPSSAIIGVRTEEAGNTHF